MAKPRSAAVVGGSVPDARHPPPLGAWRWSYVAFRFGDGATQALLPLAIVLHYGLPIWVLALTTACMNLVAVPASFLWGAVADRSTHRRRIVVLGFTVAAAAMALVATLPAVPVYVGGAMLYSMFGVATSPAASTLALHGVERRDWARRTSLLGRSTGLAFMAGMAATVALGFLAPDPPFRWLFLGGVATSGLAAVIAARTVPDATPSQTSQPPGYDPGVASAGQRLFERAVFFPSRLLFRPTFRGVWAGLHDRHRLWPLGVTLTFTGSVCFFTSYPGILSDVLLLPAGLVLLCQVPSHLVTPLAYPIAATYGLRHGESRSVQRGALLRLFGVPGLCAAILFAAGSTPALVGLLMVFHALMGVSFSLMQVNGPILFAELHPAGKGQGVGVYHAALGIGTLGGSVSAFVLLRAFDYWVSYQFAMALTLVGVTCLLIAHLRLLKERGLYPSRPS